MSGLSGSKLFDTLVVLLKIFLKILHVDFDKKNQQMTKLYEKLCSMQRIYSIISEMYLCKSWALYFRFILHV